ncbi:MAG: hypothetical protein ACYCXN_08115, partial [Acidimicrobiales bacterium]
AAPAPPAPSATPPACPRRPVIAPPTERRPSQFRHHEMGSYRVILARPADQLVVSGTCAGLAQPIPRRAASPASESQRAHADDEGAEGQWQS